MAKIDLNKIKYLSFEGGGGKGLVYLGAIKALESKFGKKISHKQSIKPIIDINALLTDDLNRPIKGVSGASAGAITAFMVTLGMSSREIENEINKTEVVAFKRSFFRGFFLSPIIGFFFKYKKVRVSQFELFFDKPNGRYMKAVVENGDKKIYDNYYIQGKITIQAGLKFFFSSFFTQLISIFTKTAKTFSQQSIIFERFFDSDEDSNEYTYSLLFNRGLFPAFTTREYFSSLIENYLYVKVDWNAILKPYLPKRAMNIETGMITTEYTLGVIPDILREIITNIDFITNVDGNNQNYNPDFKPSFKSANKLTFSELLYLTGVDLVVTGTNLTRNRSLYLSAYHTPDLPVVDAISISMNIPIIFKPVYVDYPVHKGKNISYNELYKGLWVDGGMLNNFPIHAFDEFEEVDLTFRGINSKYRLAKTKANSIEPFSNEILGFRIKGAPEIKDPLKPDFMVLTSYLSSIINTFMFSGGDGQIRTFAEENSTIYLDSFIQIDKDDEERKDDKFFEIGVTDFASYGLDLERGEKFKANYKKALIFKAEDDTLNNIGYGK